MASSAYAASSDMFGPAGYLRDPSSTANAPIMTLILNEVSRLIDEECNNTIFYDDGPGQRWINGIGGPKLDTPGGISFFFSSGTIDAASSGSTTLQYTPSYFAPRVPLATEAMVIDVGSLREVVTPSVVGTISGGKYPLTVPATSFTHAAKAVATTIQITIAYFENQPTAQWIQELDGDGWNPASNFYVWPNVVKRIGAGNQSVADNTSVEPWYGIDLPMIPISSTTWLPTTMVGKHTVGITAHWGWPVVPDFIKDLTCRAASIAWRARQAGQASSGATLTGGAVAPIGTVRAFIRSELAGSRYKMVYI